MISDVSPIIVPVHIYVWQFEVPADDFDKLENKHMVIHHMQHDHMIRVRMLSREKPTDDAIPARPILEDAYLCLIKDLK